MVASEEGQFIHARNHPKMVLITPSVDGEFLALDAPGMETLKVPLRPDLVPTIQVHQARSIYYWLCIL